MAPESIMGAVTFVGCGTTVAPGEVRWSARTLRDTATSEELMNYVLTVNKMRVPSEACSASRTLKEIKMFMVSV